MSGRTRRIALAALLACGFFGAPSDAAAQTPPAVQMDLLLMQADRLSKVGDHAGALTKLDEVLALQEQHDLEIPAEFSFRRAQALRETRAYAEAIEPLNRYFELTGREGELYREALQLLDAVQTLSRLVSDLESKMAVIPGGAFRMGCLSNDDDCNYDELPVHEVEIPSFALSKHEATRGQFSLFARATGHSAGDSCYVREGAEWKDRSGRGWHNPGFEQSDADPVVCVNWEDAQSFAAWLSEVTGHNYRLPTESEWEYAARAGTDTKFHFGDDESQLCRHANHADRSTTYDWRNAACSDSVGPRTSVVGRYEPNGFGLHDMHGNVGEWVEDCWNGSYEDAPLDGSAWQGEDCGRRVLRGGSWSYSPRNVRSAYREWGASRFSNDGFRVARTLTP